MGRRACCGMARLRGDTVKRSGSDGNAAQPAGPGGLAHWISGWGFVASTSHDPRGHRAAGGRRRPEWPAPHRPPPAGTNSQISRLAGRFGREDDALRHPAPPRRGQCNRPVRAMVCPISPLHEKADGVSMNETPAVLRRSLGGSQECPPRWTPRTRPWVAEPSWGRQASACPWSSVRTCGQGHSSSWLQEGLGGSGTSCC